nr:putative ORF1 [Marmot picobirnavirus]
MTHNQIEYWRLVETNRNNLAVEAETNRSNLAREAETKRSNLAKERETNRSNLAREKETTRSNLANERLARDNLNLNLFLTRVDQEERARANRANEVNRERVLAETHRSNVQTEILRKADQRVAEINAVTARLQAAETERANRAREQVQLYNVEENQRSNLAREAIQLAQANETARSNVAREQISRNQLTLETRKQQETERSNLARETETHRHQVMSERIDVLKAVMPFVSNNLGTLQQQASRVGSRVSSLGGKAIQTLKGVLK